MSLAYYRWFPGDYIRDTRRLTMLQHGAYRMLLDEYMVSGKPLPNDLSSLYRVCLAFSGEEQAAVRYVLEEFFRLDGPLWRHKRCDEELAHQEHRVEAAKKSINARWQKRGTNVDTNVERPKNERTYERNTNQIQSTTTAKAVVGDAVAPPSDAKKAAFDAGVALLARTHGEKEARSLVGRMRKALGDSDVLDLIRRAGDATEPVEWLMKAASRATVSKRISDANGGAKVIALDDGRYKCGAYYYSRKGEKEVAI
jgi:uncharacterized protein YdaU (DUF1376 family)